MKTRTPPPREQTIVFTCDQCGKRRQVTAVHYDRFSTGCCGKTYWALQPGRGGPLVAFPHPGFVVPEPLPAEPASES